MTVKKYEYQGPIPRIPALTILGKVEVLVFIKKLYFELNGPSKLKGKFKQGLVNTNL